MKKNELNVNGNVYTVRLRYDHAVVSDASGKEVGKVYKTTHMGSKCWRTSDRKLSSSAVEAAWRMLLDM